MRHVLIFKGLYPESQPYVIAETPDRQLAEDIHHRLLGVSIVPLHVARKDPDFAELVKAWDASDDQAQHEDWIREQAHLAIDQAFSYPPADLEDSL